MSRLTRSFINYHLNCEEALKIVLNQNDDSIQATEDLKINVSLMRIELHSQKLKDKKTAISIIRKFEPYLKEEKVVPVFKTPSSITRLEKGIKLLNLCETIGEGINNRLQKTPIHYLRNMINLLI